MFVEIAAALISLVIIISLVERYVGWKIFWLALGSVVVLALALVFPAQTLIIGVCSGALLWSGKAGNLPDWRLVEDAKEEWRRRRLGKRIV